MSEETATPESEMKALVAVAVKDAVKEHAALMKEKPTGDLSEGDLFFNVEKFEHAYRVAKLLGTAKMLPAHFQGDENIGNLMLGLSFALRVKQDPLMVLQHVYIVHGRMGIEAQLAISLINNCKRFSPLQWRMEGEAMTRKATCYATNIATGEVCEMYCDMAMAKAEGWSTKAGSKWLTMPEQMFMYRAASWLVRAYAPELSMGLHTAEEIHDVYDTRASEDGTFEVIAEPVIEDVDTETGEVLIAETVA